MKRAGHLGRIITVVILLVLITGCTLTESGEGQVMDGDGMFQTSTYSQISQEEVRKKMALDDRDDAQIHEDMTPSAITLLKVGDEVFSIELDGNSSADAFYEKLKTENISIDMHDYGGFEKVGDLPWSLPTNDEEITTIPGDLILYQGDKITVYYDENTWKFTHLGRLNVTEEEVREVFGGKDDITAEFFLEWTE